MNYLREVLAFTDFALINKLSSGQIALWYALIAINNKCGWVEWFSASNRTLEQLTGLSRNGIAIARNVLMQKGLIVFKSNNVKATSYKMISMADSVQDTVQDSVQDTVQDSVQNSGTLNKQNKTKQKESLTSDDVCLYYERVFQAVLTRTVMEQIDSFVADGAEPELICAVLDESVERGKGNWNYAKAILNNLLKRGITTAGAYQAQKKARQEEKEKQENLVAEPVMYVPSWARKEEAHA